jgi:hypothetical protein
LLIARATALIDEFTGTTFEATSDLRRFDAVEDIKDYTLYFDRWAASITHVGNGDATTDIGSDNWVPEPRNDAPYYGVTLVSHSSVDWTYDSNPENAVVVDGVWGYSTSAPADIEHACIRLVGWLYKQRETDIDLDRPALVGEGTVIMPVRLPNDVISMLQPYRFDFAVDEV